MKFNFFLLIDQKVKLGDDQITDNLFQRLNIGVSFCFTGVNT